MRSIIGYNIIVFAIVMVFTLIFGYDLEIKDKILLVTAIELFIVLLSCSAWLMTT